jgi:putative endonuclease
MGLNYPFMNTYFFQHSPHLQISVVACNNAVAGCNNAVAASEARQPIIYSRRMQPAVYILASQARGTLYVGVTSDLIRRVWQHKNNLALGFTQRYGVHMLVYFELHTSMLDAITREKQLKAGSRAKKVSLIEDTNPAWSDLYLGLL